MESFGPSASELVKAGLSSKEASIGDIHQLYQDLFLTDIKNEVEEV